MIRTFEHVKTFLVGDKKEILWINWITKKKSCIYLGAVTCYLLVDLIINVLSFIWMFSQLYICTRWCITQKGPDEVPPLHRLSNVKKFWPSFHNFLKWLHPYGVRLFDFSRITHSFKFLVKLMKILGAIDFPRELKEILHPMHYGISFY